MRLSHVAQLTIWLLSINALHAFRIKNILKYKIQWTREAGRLNDEDMLTRISSLETGETSPNIISLADELPKYVLLSKDGTSQYNEINLTTLADIISKQDLISPNTVFDIIEIEEDGKKIITLDLPKPVPAAPEPPRVTPEQTEQKKGKASDATVTEKPTSAGATPQARTAGSSCPTAEEMD